MKTISLGFEVGTGAPVNIPHDHMVVTGRTQHAGKTTTIEALLARGGAAAVIFRTKRGELEFQGGRAIAPFFRERTDWRYVELILEASLREKVRFERSWIMRVVKGQPKTLADVQRNVQRELTTAKGLNADVYYRLNEYLEDVVPQIRAAKFATKLELKPGLNVVDLRAMSLEMRSLVIASTIDEVMERLHNVTVVLPEAWEFLPQKHGSPVKPPAERLVRKGAGIGNFAWLDSQDIAGVDKTYLKACGVWLLGVQTEVNEAKHTLAQMPLATKPRAADVMALERGQFFACWGGRVVKTYVQPAWMNEPAAIATARGEMKVEATGSAGRALERFVRGGMNAQRAVDEILTRHQAEEEEDMSRIAELEEQLAQQTGLVQQREKELETRDRAIREAQAEITRLRDRTSAADELGRALARLLPARAGAAGAVDEDALINKVLARIPTSGSGPIQVTPPAKLRADFQREETERILAATKDLKPLARKVQKLLESVEGKHLSQKEIAERLGRSTGGGSWIELGAQIKELIALGFAAIEERRGVRTTLRSTIAADLATYQASDADVEAVYQTLLYAIATETPA
jgi:hypothetical protein